MLSWRRMRNIKLSVKVSNEKVLKLIGKKKTLPNITLLREFNWIGHILRRNSLARDTTEGQITEERNRRSKNTVP